MEQNGKTIKIMNAAKKFKENEVLKDVSLECKPGHIYGIIGYNGSGKTVLFKCICGFLTLDAGSILVDDKQIGKDLNIIEDAGIIIEEPAFLAKKSGYQNLDFLYGIRHKRDQEYINSILAKVGLDPSMKKPVKTYSLGMRQRLAIAQAIMENQSILILDEPMNGLDKKGVQDMRKLFLEMKEDGKTILLASHNREDINLLCDEVYEMEDGRLRREG